MYCVVTGAAGFIGSALTRRLIADGHGVLSVDLKLGDDLAIHVPKLSSADIVFHLAGRPGVHDSWNNFEDYVRNNILATRNVLEAKPKRLVFASSSTVYGNGSGPISPYGVTKKACEDLCRAYGGEVVILRYFSVYGPGQRPDMAFHRWLDAVKQDRPVEVYGSPRYRCFTFIDDTIQATVAAGEKGIPGMVYDVGGYRSSTDQAIETMEAVTGRPVRVNRISDKPGDAIGPVADTWPILNDCGILCSTTLFDGMKRQWEWINERS